MNHTVRLAGKEESHTRISTAYGGPKASRFAFEACTIPELRAIISAPLTARYFFIITFQRASPRREERPLCTRVRAQVKATSEQR